ncbi:MAG: hypothetical protein HYZ42_16520, partial [Bacteroidetes bacterium]|nr:hypothetical protein [Bacteroidota bacterium]
IFIQLSQLKAQEISRSIYIYSAENRTPISGCHVYFTKLKSKLLSDKNGLVVLKANEKQLLDYIIIESVGFEPQTITAQSLLKREIDTLFLKSKIVELNNYEMVAKYHTTRRIGIWKSCRKVLPQLTHEGEYANAYEFSQKKYYRIKHVKFYVHDFKQVDTLKIAVEVRKIDTLSTPYIDDQGGSITMVPGKKLIDTTYIVIVNKKRKYYTVDLSKSNWLNDKGVFVSIKWVNGFDKSENKNPETFISFTGAYYQQGYTVGRNRIKLDKATKNKTYINNWFYSPNQIYMAVVYETKKK